MDVANASVYDGASAAAEACAMVRERRRTVTLVSACAHPDVIATIRTYCWGSNHEMRLIPEKDGVTDLDALRGALDDQVSGVYLGFAQFPGRDRGRRAPRRKSAMRRALSSSWAPIP